MCYSNALKIKSDDFIKLVTLEVEIRKLQLSLYRPLQSGFEYGKWPILKPVDGGKSFEITEAHWEFIPTWLHTWNDVEASRKKFTTLNAIGAELLDKRMFRDAALKRRCLVLSSGFYEWRHFKPHWSKKDIAYPYYVSLPGKEYFFMAGIWQPWTDKETGETIDTFAIVTTAANSLMEQVHNIKKRMPTILPDQLALEWLQDNLAPERITDLATYQLPAPEMEAHTIPKDFRQMSDPDQNFEYNELPPLVQPA